MIREVWALDQLGRGRHPAGTISPAPGLEMDLSGGFRLYADVRLPVYTNMKGDHLVALYLGNLTLSVAL